MGLKPDEGEGQGGGLKQEQTQVDAPLPPGPVPWLGLGVVRDAVAELIAATPEGKAAKELVVRQGATVLDHGAALWAALRAHKEAEVCHFLGGCFTGTSGGTAQDAACAADGTAQDAGPATTQPLKPSAAPLPPPTEDALLKIFSLTDTFNREEVRALAFQVSCTEEQVFKYFGRLKGSVRSYLQRLQKRWQPSASSKSVGAVGGYAPSKLPHTDVQGQEFYAAAEGFGTQRLPAGVDELPATSTSQPASNSGAPGVTPATTSGLPDGGVWQKVRNLLDQDGAIAQEACGLGMFVLHMQSAVGYDLRSKILKVILATKDPMILQRLVTLHLLLVLASWLKEAELDRQITFMRLLFSVLRYAPVPLMLLKESGLPTAVLRLTKYPHKGTLLHMLGR